MDELTRQLQNLLTQADAARLAGEDLDEFRVTVANWQQAGVPLGRIVVTVADVTCKVMGPVTELDADGADFGARQIVDDCWRAGVDIQMQQHIIEGVLRGLVLRGIMLPGGTTEGVTRTWGKS